ncbi:tyrosine-type recombinase/integrase [Variovorax boronicumulans]|uniref:tyrosine-type recombinase/integrase n=1 Tax=Variovorax boronicumulans TaxID=436515 RepID=UPI00278361A4|nr:site-specific integrase [Variovorax boronicumulans]MDQ0044271.1 integrase [Variovorax boronicumulans]
MARINFTTGRLTAFSCPPDKAQAFIWDTGVVGLGVRTTPRGAQSYIFQREFQGKSPRITIGAVTDWSISAARERAREMQRDIDQGRDPRLVKAERQAADAAAFNSAKASEATVAEIWKLYLEDRKPLWGVRHHDDHLRLAKAGGEKARRGTRGRGMTIAGPLYSLMGLRLADVTAPIVEGWASKEAKTRQSSARLALRCLKAFLNWCAEHPDYKAQMQPVNPAKTRRTREALGKATAKSDVLLKEQLAAWFEAVRALPSPVMSAYLQVLLLTGARRTEVLDLKWKDVDSRWKSLVIRDKIEGERKIPLTPYVAGLLATLPRLPKNPFVFASTLAKDGRVSDPRAGMQAACKAAKIEDLTPHGLRRSFKSLTEWLEIPAGVVAQIMGHKPSATAEKHYTVRPLDLLRIHHERIEAWMLEQAGIAFRSNSDPAHEG